MNPVTIGHRKIGEGCPVYVIAEIGVNHNGQLGIATKLIDVAVEAGADAVKFQMRDIENLWVGEKMVGPPDAAGFGPTFKAYWQNLELDWGQWLTITDYCRAKGIEFLCSAWDRKSVDGCISLGVKALKIASADLTNTPLLDYINSKGLPVILSTGMAHSPMVGMALEHLGDVPKIVLQCTSTYPSAYHELDLYAIRGMRRLYGLPTGYSGHELGIHIPVAAVALGACVIERHITLDRTMPGADHAASLEPEGLKIMVRNIRDTEAALGQEVKRYHDSEGPVADNLRKSLVTNKPIDEGKEIRLGDLTIKGPGTGFAPTMKDHVVGKIAKRHIPADTVVMKEDLES